MPIVLQTPPALQSLADSINRYESCVRLGAIRLALHGARDSAPVIVIASRARCSAEWRDVSATYLGQTSETPRDASFLATIRHDIDDKATADVVEARQGAHPHPKK